MRVAALDLSSRTGVAIWDGRAGRPQLSTKKLVGWDYDAGSFLELWRIWLGDFIQVHRPELVAIEQWFVPQHGGGIDEQGKPQPFRIDGRTVGHQIGLSYFTQWCFHAARIKTVLVTSAQWRKHAFGSARSNGEDWKKRATKRCDYLGWEYPDHNAAEAGLILDWALCTVAKQNPPWRDDTLMASIAP